MEFVFRYDAKNAAKLEEERKVQAEIDEDNSCKISTKSSLATKKIISNLSSTEKHFTQITLQISPRTKEEYLTH